MKLFLEELAKHSISSLGAGTTFTRNEAYVSAVKKYSSHLGKKMLYSSKSTRDIRVVTIVGVYPNWLRFYYSVFTVKGEQKVYGSVNFGALFSGDDTLGEMDNGA